MFALNSLKCLRHVAQVRCYSPAMLTSPSVAGTYPSAAKVLYDSPEWAHKRKRLRSRTGLIATKRGSSAWFDEDGKQFPVTILEVDRVQVTHLKTPEVDGYYAVQLGYGSRAPQNVKRPLLGHFARAEVAPKEHIAEFQVKNESGLLPLGTQLSANHFTEGQHVDVQGVSKGKGFQGVMKRHGFKGLRATHGTSLAHRSAGSMGMSQDPGRILPGKKMAGHMGNKNVTIQNATVVKVDAENGLILVKGGIPGPVGGYVKISDTIKPQ